MGVPERELAGRVRAVAQHVLSEEEKARDQVLADSRSRLVRIAQSSLARLRSLETLSAGEALALLSPIRLAGSLGLVEGLSLRALNELMVELRLMRLEDPGLDAALAQDRRRAVLVRRRLRGIEV
jgi:protein arginine kinase